MSIAAMPEFLPSLNRRTCRLRRPLSVVLTIGIASLIAAQSDDRDIVDKLILNPSLRTYVNLLAKGDMLEKLKAEGPITVFAPNDAAFATLPPALLATLKKDKTILKKFLMFTLSPSRLESKDFKEGPMKTMANEAIPIGVKKGLTLGKGKFVAIDERATNGIVHVVDAVSFPPSLVKIAPKLPATPPAKPPIKQGQKKSG